MIASCNYTNYAAERSVGKVFFCLRLPGFMPRVMDPVADFYQLVFPAIADPNFEKHAKQVLHQPNQK